MKPNGKLPKNRAIQNAFLAYISDAGILAAALFPHGVTYMSPKIMIASLDHTMWFHKPDFEFNDWIFIQWTVHILEIQEDLAEGLSLPEKDKL